MFSLNDFKLIGHTYIMDIHIILFSYIKTFNFIMLGILTYLQLLFLVADSVPGPLKKCSKHTNKMNK